MDTVLPTCSYCGKEISPAGTPQTSFLEKSGVGEIPLPFCSDQCLDQWMQKRPRASSLAPEKPPPQASPLEQNLRIVQEEAVPAHEHVEQLPLPTYHLPPESAYTPIPRYPVVPEQPKSATPPDLIANNLRTLDKLSGEVQYVEHHAVRQRLKYRIRPKTLFERLKDRLKAVGIIPYDRDGE